MRDEIFLMTHSYVYHPALLTLDIGGGPILDKGSYASDSTDTQSSKQMYNLTSRATFLRDKPYRGSVFYEHLNPTQSVGPAQIMLSENTKYGFNFSLLAPVTPLPLHVDASRSHTQGSSAEQTIDDRIDQVSLRTERDLGTLGNTRLNYQAIRQDSLSGSSNLPIQGSHSSSDIVNVDTRIKLGARREYDLTNLIMFRTQNYSLGQGAIADFKDLNFSLNMLGRHSDVLQTYANYNLSTSDRSDQTSTLNAVSAGVSYQAYPNLSGTLAARADYNKTTQFTSKLSGINGSATYRRELPVGVATGNYTFSYFLRNQDATAQQTHVIGEHVTLAGTTLVTLGTQQIVSGSIVVVNLTRTQTFVEGRDYALSTLGLRTRIQRVIGGSIIDGQEVLVDYTADVGGSFALTQLDQGVNLNWQLKSYLSAYLRYLDSAPHLASGAPTFQLNPVKSTIYGTRADVPLSLLSQEFLLGGYTEREDRRELIAPSERTYYEAYTQTVLPFVRQGGIRLAARHTKVDYELNPTNGVNLTGYDLRLWSRLPYGIDFSLDARRDRDTGGLIPRQSTYATAKAQWRMRRVQLTFDLTRTQESQGAAERTLTRGQIIMRRTF